MHIILASASPRRQELLAWLNLDFEVIPSNFDETLVVEDAVEDLVEELALQKALVISRDHPESLVIGADTMVSLGDKLIGKANSRQDARETMELLSGQTHQVTTGMALIDPDQAVPIMFHVKSFVSFRPISQVELIEYLDTAHWQDKAGAYAIQEDASKFVTGYEGSFTNIIGLPLLRLAEELENIGVETPEDLNQIIESYTGMREV